MHDEPARRKRLVEPLQHRSGALDRDRRVDGFDRRGNHRRRRHRARSQPDHEPGPRHRALIQTLVVGALVALPGQARVQDVPDHADDRHPRRRRPADPYPLSDRVLAGPVLLRQVLVDHHDALGPEPVVIGEHAPALSGNPERGKVPRAHDPASAVRAGLVGRHRLSLDPNEAVESPPWNGSGAPHPPPPRSGSRAADRSARGRTPTAARASCTGGREGPRCPMTTPRVSKPGFTSCRRLRLLIKQARPDQQYHRQRGLADDQRRTHALPAEASGSRPRGGFQMLDRRHARDLPRRRQREQQRRRNRDAEREEQHRQVDRPA